MNTPHVVAEPHILYLGTPVVLVSTVNEDGTHNLAPISSVFWLGWRGVLGIEAVVAASHGIAEDSDKLRGALSLIEVRIQRVHVHPDLLMAGHANRIDPDKWSPLIMSFQKFYRLSGQVHPSRLAEIPERAYEPLAKA
jgi:flavin reductase (DIM6/NTAB) family NADH-FMN oxidoreductase RutF